MAKSILQKADRCLVCRSSLFLEEHHVFEGARRQLSEKYGLKVKLCPVHHRISNQSVHLNEDINRDLKRWAQRKAMEHYGWTIEDFIEIMGKNYLEE